MDPEQIPPTVPEAHCTSEPTPQLILRTPLPAEEEATMCLFFHLTHSLCQHIAVVYVQPCPLHRSPVSLWHRLLSLRRRCRANALNTRHLCMIGRCLLCEAKWEKEAARRLVRLERINGPRVAAKGHVF